MTNLPSVYVVPSMPQVFIGSQPGFAAAVNQDGTTNSASNPAPLGSIVTIWATGLGPEAGTDGTINQRPSTIRGVAIVTTNESLEVLYAGDAPGSVLGLSQINFRLPQSLLSGARSVTFTLQTPTAASDSVAIHVAPTGA